MRRMAIVGLVALSVLGLMNCGYAVSTGTFDNIFMVGSSGSTVPKSTFSLSETPWLYLNLPNTGFNAAASFWTDNLGNSFSVSGVSGNKQYWFSLDSGLDGANLPVTWASVKRLGEWNVNAVYLYPFDQKNPAGYGATKFTVVPEPVSTTLFLLGGTVLLARRLRKAKR